MTSLPIALFCSIFHIPRFPLFVPRSLFPRGLVTSYCGRGNIRHKIRKADITPRLLFCSLFKFPCIYIYQQIVCTQHTAHEKKKKIKQQQQNKTDKKETKDHSNKPFSPCSNVKKFCLFFSRVFLQIKGQFRIFPCAFIWHTDWNERTI